MRTDGLPSTFFSDLGAILDGRIDRLTPAALIAAIGRIVPHEAGLCVVNSRGEPPTYLCDTFRDAEAKRAVQRYVRGTYLINPGYNAFLGGLAEGVYRMRDLLPGRDLPAADHDLEITSESAEEIGFRTFDWPAGKEELVIAMALPGSRMGEISLSRPRRLGGFAGPEVARLGSVLPLVAAIFRRIWHEIGTQMAPAHAPGSSLETFGRDRLSAREATVVQMILKGHSSQSIGLNLDIGLATVKTHRQNAYAKLGIATQQELFATFIRHLGLDEL